MNVSLLIGFFLIYILCGAIWLDLLPESIEGNYIKEIFQPIRSTLMFMGIWFAFSINKIDKEKFLFVYFIGWLLILAPPLIISGVQEFFYVSVKFKFIDVLSSIYVCFSILLVIVAPNYIYNAIKFNKEVTCSLPKVLRVFIIPFILSVIFPLYIINFYIIINEVIMGELSLHLNDVQKTWYITKVICQLVAISVTTFIFIRSIVITKNIQSILLSLSGFILSILIYLSNVNVYDIVTNIVSGIVVLVIGDMLIKRNKKVSES